MIYTCPNELEVSVLIYAMMLALLLILILFVLLKKGMDVYNDVYVQFETLKRDLELNTMLKHEHIQNLLCPNDLVDFNNQHIFELDKCKNCKKDCKKDCWIKYFIDKSTQ